MDKLYEDLILLVFMHFVSTYLFFYVSIKLFNWDIRFQKLLLVTVFYTIFSYLIRKIIILTGMSVNLFIPLNLVLTTIIMILMIKMPWRYAIIGTLVSFLSILLWAPVAYLIAKSLGWEFPSQNLIENIIGAYLEMFGLILLAGYLKFSNTNIFKLLRINK